MATTKKLQSLTSNQYYKGLNNRYDNRIKKLMKASFLLNREFMVWYKGTFYISDLKNHRLMSNEFVFHADNRAFNDKVSRM